MRWAINAVNVGDDTIKSVLEAERDHYLRTSPMMTPKLEELKDAIIKSYNLQMAPEIARSLIAARDKEIEENPHVDTPRLVEQMNDAIAGAVAVLAASPQRDMVNVTIAGSFDERLGTSEQETTFGFRLSINVDWVDENRSVMSKPVVNPTAVSTTGTKP